MKIYTINRCLISSAARKVCKNSARWSVFAQSMQLLRCSDYPQCRSRFDSLKKFFGIFRFTEFEFGSVTIDFDRFSSRSRKLQLSRGSQILFDWVKSQFELEIDLQMNNSRFLFMTSILLVICASFHENYLSHATLSKDQGVYHIEGKMQTRDQNGNESCELNNISNHNYVERVLAKPVRNKRHDDSIWSSASFASKLLLCFSHRINLEAIFNTGSSTEHSLRCIHGIRLLTLLWTILVHTYVNIF